MLKLHYLLIDFDLPIYLVFLIIQLIVLNLPLFQSYIKSKNPFRGGCIKHQCAREDFIVTSPLKGDHDFFYTEFCLIKIVMYFIDC